MGFIDEDTSHWKTPSEEIFLTLGRVLGIAFNLDELLNLLVRLVVESVHPADAGIVYVCDKRLLQLVAGASYGYHRSDIRCSLRAGEGASGQCYVLCKPLIFSSIDAVMEQTATLRSDNLDSHTKLREGLPPILSMVTIPLVLRENIFGVIQLEHYKEHRPFSQADLSRSEALSSWISLVLDYAQSQLELKHTKRSYRELLGRFIARSEEERKRIAREIHDDVNQLLLCAKLDLENIGSALPADLVQVRQRLEVSTSRINQVFAGLRELSVSLRPPALDELGLHQALDWYIHSRLNETRFPIALEVSGLSQRRPAPVIEMALFRIAQEALSNVTKHARATSARVKLNFGKSLLVLEVEDDGRGFDTNAGFRISGDKQNLGLLGMMERAKLCGGSLKVDSAPGRGTRLRVDIPVGSYDWGVY